jgi:hypothetical protein
MFGASPKISPAASTTTDPDATAMRGKRRLAGAYPSIFR